MRDPTNLETLLTERAWLRRVAAALVKEPAAADDLVQDTYLRALERGSTRVNHPRAWLASILRNLAINRARADRRRAAREQGALGGDVRTPDQLLARAELLEAVSRSVRALPEPHRATVLLRYFEGLSPPAIAAHMDVPLETVRTRLKKSLRILRARMDVEADGDRRTWMAALVPISGALGLPTKAAGAQLLGGMFVMSTGKKLAVCAALVLLGLWGVLESGLLDTDVEPGARGSESVPIEAESSPHLAVRTPPTPEATR